MAESSDKNKLWYLLPIILGILGGVIGYFLTKRKNKKFAERLLLVGLVVFLIHIFFYFTLAAALYPLFSILWAQPLEQKREDQKNLEDSLETIYQLNQKILSVIQTGNKQSLDVSVDGEWLVNISDNSVLLRFSSKISNEVSDAGWIELSSGNGTTIYIRSDTVSGGFDMQYKIKFADNWKIEGGDKTTSSNLKSIDVTKENNSIKITLVE